MSLFLRKISGNADRPQHQLKFTSAAVLAVFDSTAIYTAGKTKNNFTNIKIYLLIYNAA